MSRESCCDAVTNPTTPIPVTSDDRAVMSKVIDEQWPRLRRFFRSKAPEPEVLDLAQRTLLIYVEKVSAGEATSAGFLWGIARNVLRQHYDRARVAQPFDSTIHSVMDMGPRVSSQLSDRHQLAIALRSLPADQQMAFELRHGEELSLEEVSEALGVSLATTKRYLAAARDALGDHFGPASGYYRSS